MTISEICDLLSKTRLPVHDEKRTQAAIEALFIANGIEHEREVRLTKKDIIDFVVGDLGIEVKIKGSAMTIYRQLQRYAESDKVGEILLLTATNMKLPETINGKPAHIYNLNTNWL